jgi:hypothetical protein
VECEASDSSSVRGTSPRYPTLVTPATQCQSLGFAHGQGGSAPLARLPDWLHLAAREKGPLVKDDSRYDGCDIRGSGGRQFRERCDDGRVDSHLPRTVCTVPRPSSVECTVPAVSGARRTRLFARVHTPRRGCRLSQPCRVRGLQSVDSVRGCSDG